MWSTNISVLLFALWTAVAFAAESLDSRAAWVSSRYISMMTANRNSGVNEAKASSEADHMLTQVMNHPPFRSLASQATSLADNGQIDKDQALELVQKASTEYAKWSAGPSFASVTSYYKNNIKDFNTDAMTSQEKSQFGQYAPFITPRISQFFSDAKGQQISQTAKALATHVDVDFNGAKARKPREHL